jgi:hypothetical protein
VGRPGVTRGLPVVIPSEVRARDGGCAGEGAQGEGMREGGEWECLWEKAPRVGGGGGVCKDVQERVHEEGRWGDRA